VLVNVVPRQGMSEWVLITELLYSTHNCIGPGPWDYGQNKMLCNAQGLGSTWIEGLLNAHTLNQVNCSPFCSVGKLNQLPVVWHPLKSLSMLGHSRW
jgi:hypothetical protein